MLSVTGVGPYSWRITILDLTGQTEPLVIETEPLVIEREGLSFSTLKWSKDETKLELISRKNLADPKQVGSLNVLEWDASNGKPLGSTPIGIQIPRPSYARFDPDRKLMIFVDLSNSDRTKPDISVYDLSKNQILGTLSNPKRSTVGTVRDIIVSRDGATLAVIRIDGLIELWDLTTRTLRTTLTDHSPDFLPESVVFSSDPNVLIDLATSHSWTSSIDRATSFIGSWITSRGKFYGPLVETVVFDLKTAKVRAKLPNELQPVVSEDGKRMATVGKDAVIRLWDLSRP